MSAAAARRAVWIAAARLRALRAAGPGSRFDAFLAPALGFDDVLQLPVWALLSDLAVARYASLVGAAAVARTWRTSLDGEGLRAAATAVGASALDALLALPADRLPQVDCATAARGDATALQALGGALLLADLPGRGLVDLLTGRLPGGPQPHASRSAARSARAAADSVMSALRGAA